MTTKKILSYFLMAWVIIIIGGLFKIEHWRYASVILIIGFLAQAAALIILIISLLKNGKK